MKKNSRIVIIKLMSLLCFMTLASLINADGKSRRKQNALPDNFVYTQVFFQVVGFDKEAEKLQNEQDKLFYKDFFKREANLSEEQNQILKTGAYNFTSVFPLTPNNQKLKLVLLYRDELKRSFGTDEFNRFNLS